VIVTQVPSLRTLWVDRARHRCALGAAALSVLILPALAVHASFRGAVAEFRWVGVAMVAFSAGRLAGRGRDLVLGVFAGATALQVVVALAERAANTPLGLTRLGEPATSLALGGRYPSTGLTLHPYVLSAWCVLGGAILVAALARAGKPPKALVLAAVLSFAGVGLTMCRSGALATVLVIACLAVASLRHPSLRVVVAAAALVTALGFALDFSGWAGRASDTTTADSAAEVTSDRTLLIKQAWLLWKVSPVIGVGPALYLDALHAHPDVEKLVAPPPRPVHVVPLLLLVEDGVVVLPALLLLGWAVATQTRRAGMLGLAVTLAVLPFLFLDHLNWSYPQGLFLTAVWLGALDNLGASAQR
jgi:hypothetical protein